MARSSLIKVFALCMLLPLAACGDVTSPVEATSARIEVCMKPDTVPVTIKGDSTAFVFRNCF